MPRIIRYHRHCIDGIVCAALVRRAMPEITDAIPYGHLPRGETPPYVEDAVGVDIPYLPGMTLWYDHHASGLQFLANDGTRPIHCAMHFDPAARCCAELLTRPRAFDALIAAVMQQDSGWFPNPEAAHDLTNPVILATRTVSRLLDPAIDQRIIDDLAYTTRDPITALLEAIPRAERMRTIDIALSHEELLRREAQWTGPILHFDLSAYGNETDAISPFQPYLHFPHAPCYVALFDTRQRAYVRLSTNPWLTWPGRGGQPRLDHIAAELGGGGHPHVAGITHPTTERGRSASRNAFATAIQHLVALHG